MSRYSLSFKLEVVQHYLSGPKPEGNVMAQILVFTNNEEARVINVWVYQSRVSH